MSAQDQFVLIAVMDYSTEAEILRGLLEANGMKVVLRETRRKFELYVPAADQEEAKKLADQLLNE